MSQPPAATPAIPAAPAAAGRAPDRASPGVVLFWVVVAALVLGRVGGPVARSISAVGTAVHEIGHAATADVLTGDVEGITVFRDGGGITVSEHTEAGWRRFIVAGSGYPAPLLAALALLTGALLGRTGRRLAAAGAVAAAVSLALWVPFRPASAGIAAADQRFTWWVVAATAALLAAAAALPDRHSTVRRVALGAVAVALLTDAFRAADDLQVLTGARQPIATDAHSLAAITDVGSAGLWAWLMRLALLGIAGGWAWWLFTRWTAAGVVMPAGASEG